MDDTTLMSQVDQLLAPYRTETGWAVEVEDIIELLKQDTPVLQRLDRLEQHASMAADYAKRARAKAQQLTRRADFARSVMQAILEAIPLKKLERPTYTASLVKSPQHAITTDESQLPEAFFVRKVDGRALLAALRTGPVPGAELSNQQMTLRIVRGRLSTDTIEPDTETTDE